MSCGRACLDKDIQARSQAFHVELIQQPVRARLQDVQPGPGGVNCEPALECGCVERRHRLYELPGLQSSKLCVKLSAFVESIMQSMMRSMTQVPHVCRNGQGVEVEEYL